MQSRSILHSASANLNESMFYYLIYLKMNFEVEKKQINLLNLHPILVFAMANLYQIILEKRWSDGESWPDE